MEKEARTRPDWLNRTNLMIGIVVGLGTVIGGVGALFADEGPSAVERYRSGLADDLCGDLKAAVQTSQPQSYAGEEGSISKPAWLAAMDTAAGHLAEGREAFQGHPPPSELRDEWKAMDESWQSLMTFWAEYRRETAALPEEELTVFHYPPPRVAQRLNAVNSSFGAPIERLMKTPCG